jgi:hypothetical protein
MGCIGYTEIFGYYINGIVKNVKLGEMKLQSSLILTDHLDFVRTD